MDHEKAMDVTCHLSFFFFHKNGLNSHPPIFNKLTDFLEKIDGSKLKWFPPTYVYYTLNVTKLLQFYQKIKRSQMALFGLRKAIILSVKRMECGQEEWFQFCTSATSSASHVQYDILSPSYCYTTIFFAASFKRLENNFRSRKPLRRAVCQNNTRCDWREQNSRKVRFYEEIYSSIPFVLEDQRSEEITNMFDTFSIWHHLKTLQNLKKENRNIKNFTLDDHFISNWFFFFVFQIFNHCPSFQFL